jgi:hypothetical protein
MIGGDAVAKLHVEPGTYTIIVKPGDDYMVKGGFSYELEISGGPAADAAPAVANVAKPAAAGNALTAQVDLLNELCPDTFCEGDYQYTFKKLECPEASKCVLSFDAKDLKGTAFAAQVPVVGFKTDKFPAFYLRESAAGVDARFDDVAKLAAFVSSELERTGRGVLGPVDLDATGPIVSGIGRQPIDRRALQGQERAWPQPELPLRLQPFVDHAVEDFGLAKTVLAFAKGPLRLVRDQDGGLRHAVARTRRGVIGHCPRAGQPHDRSSRGSRACSRSPRCHRRSSAAALPPVRESCAPSGPIRSAVQDCGASDSPFPVKRFMPVF